MPDPPPYPKAHALLEDKVVLITASAGAGIGVATAKRCLEEGARVVLSDRHERRLAETAEQLTEIRGTQPLAVRCDVTRSDDIENLFDTAIREEGRVDVLVNNAGLGGTATIVEMTDDEWDAVMDVTLKSVLRCTRAALKHMMPRGSGAIVNLSSILGWRAQGGQAHYAAAKAGVMALTRVAAIEAAGSGVRVNAVAPSLAMHAFLAKVIDEATLADLVKLEAFGRSAETWEIANVIVFLASEYSSYMTGEVISVSSQHP